MALATALLHWYDTSARDLPWRRTSDPYAILVSEVMLQQTQVQTVIPYYHRFLERFPTVEMLAQSPLDDVLSLWKGLGYYRRAQNLHKAAGVMMRDHGGQVPAEYDAIRGLPGIGDYTAAAVLSIAYQKVYPVLDGNVARVASRLWCIDEPIEMSQTKRTMTAHLEQVISRTRPGDFNQAMMELGARICHPTNPDCAKCPVSGWCQARVLGRVEELPVRRARPEVRVEERTVVLVRVDPFVYVRRRDDHGLLARMWEFPHDIGQADQVVPRILAQLVPLPVGEDESAARIVPADEAPWQWRFIGRVEHRFSHLEWRMDVVEASPKLDGVRGVERVKEDGMAVGGGLRQQAATPGDSSAPIGRWVKTRDLETLALPRAMQKVWALQGAGAQLSLPMLEESQ